MFSYCANPECKVAFDYLQGQLFRFHKDHAVNEQPPNTHSVQHFWLCGTCCHTLTLEYRNGCGVLIKDRPEICAHPDALRLIAAA